MFCYNPLGYDGGMVSIEVDVRRGLPATDIVGLAGTAVKEARERVRVAIKNSGFEYPSGHVLVNLSPAGTPKSGSAFDLPIALAILLAGLEDSDSKSIIAARSVLAMGELDLGGGIRKTEGVLPALIEARRLGIKTCIVPWENAPEASMIMPGRCFALRELGEAFSCLKQGRAPPERPVKPVSSGGVSPAPKHEGATAGQGSSVFDSGKLEPRLALALLCAAAGCHHIMLYGPPGVGKTMALQFMGKLLPALSEEEMLEVNRLHSLAGLLGPETGLIDSAPIRMPHHGSSAEAILGGGRHCRPGEISLAHRGLLILDEVTEFRKNVLQALREPVEEGLIRIARAEGTVWYPARCILAMSLNPCPCGRLGSPDSVCVCSPQEIQRYWGRIGSPLLDRTDIRVFVGQGKNYPHDEKLWGLLSRELEWDGAFLDFRKLMSAVLGARIRQDTRFREGEADRGRGILRNAHLRGLDVERFCVLSQAAKRELPRLAHGAIRSVHSVLRLARTVADLRGQEEIDELSLLLAAELRTPISILPGLELMA